MAPCVHAGFLTAAAELMPLIGQLMDSEADPIAVAKAGAAPDMSDVPWDWHLMALDTCRLPLHHMPHHALQLSSDLQPRCRPHCSPIEPTWAFLLHIGHQSPVAAPFTRPEGSQAVLQRRWQLARLRACTPCLQWSSRWAFVRQAPPHPSSRSGASPTPALAERRPATGAGSVLRYASPTPTP